MDRPFMNVNEVMEDMRRFGYKISAKRFNMMVDQGEFPFVKVLTVSAGGRRTQSIFRKDYEAWRKEHLEVTA